MDYKVKNKNAMDVINILTKSGFVISELKHSASKRQQYRMRIRVEYNIAFTEKNMVADFIKILMRNKFLVDDIHQVVGHESKRIIVAHVNREE